jgi:hypothetical protein
MAITKYNPRTIWLGGEITEVNDIASSGVIKPGMLLERYNAGGVPKFRAHSTSGSSGACIVALNQPELNQSYDVPYKDGDLIHAGIGRSGTTFYVLLTASGTALVPGDGLESNGDGTLKKSAGATRMFNVVEAYTPSAVPYARAEVI